jgi:hypothetical protein
MMRSRTLLVPVVVGIVVLIGGGAGCAALTETEEGAEHEHAIAAVDSLQVPDRIAPSDTLSVRMHGTVGPNGCHSFDGFDASRSRDRLTVTPRVEHKTDGMCTMAIVPLDETYTAPPPFENGTFTIVVPQPDEPDLTTTVEVR